ncbi:2,3-dihydro-2,3-dihydroxybenzoate dehydrogenase [Streptomyces albidoflavus]
MHGKVALVTGAAGGIGAATVRALAARGVLVAALDLNHQELLEQAEKLAADGLATRPFAVDVSEAREVEAVTSRVEADLGPIEYLVNAAGVLRTGSASDYDDADWQTTFAVNVDGVFHTSRAVVRRMVARGSGAIVTVASNAASTPRAGMAAYAASKAAAAMFTKSLGLEVARHNIRCNVLAPGSTDTSMLRSMWPDERAERATLDGNPDSFRVGIPLGRIAEPEDMAQAAVFLLSDAAQQITLHSLTVDGGASLGA